MIKKIILLSIIIFMIPGIVLSQISWVENSPETGGAYNSIATGDFNYDGLPDIAAAPASGGIRIWYRTLIGWQYPPESLPTSLVFQSIAVGDIDFDGLLDVAGSGNNLIEVYLHKYNAPSGTFSWMEANNFNPPPSGYYNYITLANVNRPEEQYGCVSYSPNPCQSTMPAGLDIIVADNAGDGRGLKIYLWAGLISVGPSECEGSWSEEKDVIGLPESGKHTQIIAKDIDGDNDIDLALSKDGGLNVLFRTYYVSSSGCYMPDLHDRFAPEWAVNTGEPLYSNELPTQGYYRSLTLADINYDGYPDIIAAGDPTENMINPGIEVWYGKPPYYEPGASRWLWTKEINILNPFKYFLIAGTYPFIGSSDFNGDNIPDIAAISASPPALVWKGHLFTYDAVNFKPARFWWESETPPSSTSSYRMLAIADFNIDGKQDIAYASNTTGGIDVFLRTSADINSPTAWYPQNIYTSSGVEPMVRYSGTGNFTAGGDDASSQSLLAQPDPVAAYVVLTLDNDPALNDIKLFKTRGEKDWTEIAAPVANGKYMDAQLDRINNDEYFDIAAAKVTTAGQVDGIRVWFQEPQAGNWIEHSEGLLCDGKYNELALIDINNDKFKDIAAVRTNHDNATGRLEFWLGLPDENATWRWQLADYKNISSPAKSITKGDFNNDGLDDVAICTLAPNALIRVYYNTLSGWQEDTITELGYDCWKIVAARIDPDEYLDVMVTTTGGGIRIYRHYQDTNGWHWQSVNPPANSNSYSGVVAIDDNADGCTDIVAEMDSSLSAPVIRTWRMGKSGSGCQVGEWSEQPQTDSGYSCSDLDSADLSLDHLPDIISTCDASSGLHVLRANYNYTGAAVPTLIAPTDGSEITNTRQPQFRVSSTSSYSNCLRFLIEIDGTSPYDFNPPDDQFIGFINPKGWDNFCYPTGAIAIHDMQVTDNYPGGLPDGLYYWRARAYDNFGLSNPAVRIYFTVNAADKIAPGPTNPIFVSKIANGVRLTWAKNPESDVGKYRIFRGTASNFIPLPSNMINEYNCWPSCPSTITYDDLAFIGSFPIYFYKVKAVDTTGNQGQ